MNIKMSLNLIFKMKLILHIQKTLVLKELVMHFILNDL